MVEQITTYEAIELSDLARIHAQRLGRGVLYVYAPKPTKALSPQPVRFTARNARGDHLVIPSPAIRAFRHIEPAILNALKPEGVSVGVHKEPGMDDIALMTSDINALGGRTGFIGFVDSRPFRAIDPHTSEPLAFVTQNEVEIIAGATVTLHDIALPIIETDDPAGYFYGGLVRDGHE